MPTPPRRRWFQVSLGTMLLLVTLFAIWLGLEVRWIRGRIALRVAIEDAAGTVVVYGSDSDTLPRSYTAPTVPIWRRWFGDEHIRWIELPLDSSNQEVRQARKLFPEAAVFIGPPPGAEEPDAR